MDIDIVEVVAVVMAMLISLTVHEVAHARTALAFGDPTAESLGRTSFNPLVHLDLYGTLAFVLSSLAGAGIGWAKPVPVNPANLQPRRLGDIMVSFAGPMSNLALAALSGTLLWLWLSFPVLSSQTLLAEFLSEFLLIMLVANISLFLFNLIPLYPLDGHHIQRELLPCRLQMPYMRWQMSYGQNVLLAVIFLPRLLSMGTEIQIPSLIGTLRTLVLRPILDFILSNTIS